MSRSCRTPAAVTGRPGPGQSMLLGVVALGHDDAGSQAGSGKYRQNIGRGEKGNDDRGVGEAQHPPQAKESSCIGNQGNDLRSRCSNRIQCRAVDCRMQRILVAGTLGKRNDAYAQSSGCPVVGQPRQDALRPPASQVSNNQGDIVRTLLGSLPSVSRTPELPVARVSPCTHQHSSSTALRICWPCLMGS